MAEQAVIRISAQDDASKVLKQIAASMNQMAASSKTSFTQVNQSVSASAASLSRLSTIVTGAALFKGFQMLAGAVTGVARSMIAASDSWVQMQQRLTMVTSSTGELINVQQKLYKLAQDARTPLGAVANLYSRVARNTAQLGLNMQQTLDVTESISKAFAVGGSTATEMEYSVIQLGQALASGTLRGDELRSVLEQAPRLAEAIAKGMGTTIGGLRKLGSEGKITSEALARSLLQALPEIREEFDRMPPSINQMMINISNIMLKFKGQMASEIGINSMFKDLLDWFKTTERSGVFEEWAQKIGGALKTVADNIKGLFSNITPEMLSSTVEMLSVIIKAVGEFVGLLATSVGLLVKIPVVQDAFVALGGAITMLGEACKAMNAALKNLSDFVDKNPTLLKVLSVVAGAGVGFLAGGPVGALIGAAGTTLVGATMEVAGGRPDFVTGKRGKSQAELDFDEMIAFANRGGLELPMEPTTPGSAQGDRERQIKSKEDIAAAEAKHVESLGALNKFLDSELADKAKRKKEEDKAEEDLKEKQEKLRGQLREEVIEGRRRSSISSSMGTAVIGSSAFGTVASGTNTGELNRSWRTGSSGYGKKLSDPYRNLREQLVETTGSFTSLSEAQRKYHLESSALLPDTTTGWERAAKKVKDFWIVGDGSVFGSLGVALKTYKTAIGTFTQQLQSEMTQVLSSFHQDLSAGFQDLLFGSENVENAEKAADILKDLRPLAGGLSLDILGKGGIQSEASLAEMETFFERLDRLSLSDEARTSIEELRTEMYGVFARPDSTEKAQFIEKLADTIGDLRDEGSVWNRFREFGNRMGGNLREGFETSTGDLLANYVMGKLTDETTVNMLKGAAGWLGGQIGGMFKDDVNKGLPTDKEWATFMSPPSSPSPIPAPDHAAFDSAMTAIGNAGQAAWDKLQVIGGKIPKPDWSEAWGAIADFGGAVGDGVSAITGSINTIGSKIPKPDWSEAWDAIADFGGAVGDGVTSIIGGLGSIGGKIPKPDFSEASSAISSFGSSMADTGRSWASSLKAGVNALDDSIFDFDFFFAIADGLGAVGDQMGSIGSGFVSALKGAVDADGGSIFEKLQTAVSDMAKFGDKAITLTANVVKGGAQDVWGKVEQVWGFISKPIALTASVITGGAQEAWSQVQQVWGFASKAVSLTANVAKGGAQDVWDNVLSMWSLGSKTISIVADIASSSISSITDLFGSMGDIGKGIKSGLGSTILDAFAAGELGAAIGGLFGKNGAIGGQIGAALGSVLGSFAGPGGAAIGAAIGGALGTAIGALVGPGAAESRANTIGEIQQSIRQGNIANFSATENFWRATSDEVKTSAGAVVGYSENKDRVALTIETFASALGISLQDARTLYNYLANPSMRTEAETARLNTILGADTWRGMWGGVTTPSSTGGTTTGGGTTGGTTPTAEVPISALAARFSAQYMGRQISRSLLKSTIGPGRIAAVLDSVSTVLGLDRTQKDYFTDIANSNNYGGSGGEAERFFQGGGFTFVAQKGIARVPGGENQAFPAILHGGERVLTAEENRRMSVGSVGNSAVNVTFVINATSDAELVRLIRDQAAPIVVRAVEQSIRQKARYGQFSFDDRAVRKTSNVLN